MSMRTEEYDALAGPVPAANRPVLDPDAEVLTASARPVRRTAEGWDMTVALDRCRDIAHAVCRGFSPDRPYHLRKYEEYETSKFYCEIDCTPISDDNWGRQVKTYELFIAYIRHENDLTNQRITWFLLSQALIGAAMGYLFSKYSPSVVRSFNFTNTDFNARVALVIALWLLISFTGVVVSASARNSMDAANVARESVRHLWSKVLSVKARNAFPDLLGGKIIGGGKDTGGDFARDMPALAWFGWSLCFAAPFFAYGFKYVFYHIL